MGRVRQVRRTRTTVFEEIKNPEQNLRFGFGVADEVRKRLITLWNTYSFFVTYARLDDFDPNSYDDLFSLNLTKLDKWILAKVNDLVRESTSYYNEYQIYKFLDNGVRFIDDLSNWYVRRNRRRFWKSENDNDKNAAYFTLYNALITYTKIMAPIIPTKIAVTDVIELHPAVIATNPASGPNITQQGSGFLKKANEIPRPVNKPNAAARNVLISIKGTVSSIAPLLPPLKPNQPNHKIKVPKTANGKLDPVNFPLFASEYLPILGPKINTAAKAIHPPTE